MVARDSAIRLRCCAAVVGTQLGVLISISPDVLAQPPTFKLAYYNIQSGKGEAALPGRTSTFVDTSNCSDPQQPMNAWGVGIVQRELVDHVGNDPQIVALGLGEAWVCATPQRVSAVLGWRGVSTARNGIAVVARYGFDGPEVWQKLDTSLNQNPADAMWVLRVPVCLDANCSRSFPMMSAHWYASDNLSATATIDRQAAQTVAFMQQLGASQPHVLIGDLNVWEAPVARVCNQNVLSAGLDRLRGAGYLDAWHHLYGDLEGFTGMTNRAGCGVPEGYVWKRIDYAWSSPGLTPVSMTRFGVVPGGEEAPSDHYGIIAEYGIPEDQPQQQPEPLPSLVPAPGDAVIHLADATTFAGNWRLIDDATAASGKAVEVPDLGAPKRTSASADPVEYVEASFTAERGRAYRLWVRGRAARNAWTNDSIFVQFSGSVTSAGASIWRIGTTSATVVSIQECGGCGLSGWGWEDNGYGTLGPLVYFAQTGPQTIRIQTREDGVVIDQIVLSPNAHLTERPGSVRDDATIIGSTKASSLEIVRYASAATITGDWVRGADSSAASGVAVANVERGRPKLSAALATPSNYLTLTFTAEAYRPYRLWLRGRATNDSWTNDSVYVQFDRAVNESGAPMWRIGTTSATWVSIEDCSGCGLSGWGWQDNGYGLNVLGPVVYFQTAGPQTIRIQQREDGVILDQIVLSARQYLTARPGAAKNDVTILPRR